jgi:DNA-binding SARP family transcriptional activator
MGDRVDEQQLRFGVLGPLQVERGGTALALPRSAVLRGLLGVLLLAEGRPVPPSRLISLVWTDQREVRRQSVQVGVCRLRDWLAGLGSPAAAGTTAAAGAIGSTAAGATGDRGQPVIGHASGGYYLVIDPTALDLHRFRAEVAAAGTEPDPAQRCRLLADALTLSRGPVLADLAGLPARDPLLTAADDTVRGATLALADCALATGQGGAAVGRLEALAETRRLDEPVYARLIEALAASRRPAEALVRYEQLRARLGDELGVSPSAEVQRAYLAVLDQDRVLAGGRPAAAGPLPASPPRPGMLPPDVADFTGREAVVGRLSELLGGAGEATAVPVAVLAGTAGVGKTTLAVHLAHRLRDRFPDGQLFVDLHGSGPTPVEPAEVLARFLRALGSGGADLPDRLDERVELYRALLAERRVLVVLDDAARHDQVRPLLPGGPGCAVLVTGRRGLTGLGTDLTRLDVLGRPAALQLLGRVAGPDRLAAEPDAAVLLVERCGRLPLAIRIAGGRLARRQHRSLCWLADRMADERTRLDELALGDLAVRPRLEAVYRRLDAGSKRLLRRLALLDGLDFSSWLAGALLDVPAGLGEELLERLVDEQLIQVAGRYSGRHLRYQMPELVRAYARERADAEETAADAAAARDRVLASWLALTLVGPPVRSADRPAGAARRTPRLAGPRTAAQFSGGTLARPGGRRHDLDGGCRPAV